MQEAKQVTFKTPSPAISPNPSEASSDSHRSQLSTPPLLSSTSQRDPMSSSPMPHHLGQMYQIGTPPQGQGTSFGRQNQSSESNFPSQQHQQFGGQPPWGGMSGNISSPHNMSRSLHQQNQPMNTGPAFNMQRNGSGPSPQTVLQQLQSTTPNQSDLLTAGIFNRPPLEGFHQLGGAVPPRPGVDIPNRMREPAPRMLEMMGMTRAPPSFGPVDGLGNTCRMHPQGTEGQGLDSSCMTQAQFRQHQSQQDMDTVTSQAKMNPVTHPLLSPGAMNAHLFGIDGRQNVSVSSGTGVSGGPRNVFGDSDVGAPRGPGLSPPMGMGWGPGHNESKSYHMSHPPPTLASLLQQHAPVDMRLNLQLDHGSDQLTSGLARLPGGPSVHNPAINSRSPPGVGPLGTVPLGMLSMPSTQPPGSIPHSQPPRGQPFMQEGEVEGPSGNTYSLFSPMSGGGMGMGVGPSRTVPHPLYPSSSQPSGQQSLWSGPGPSPLERLLEQKKYSNVPK